LSEKYKQASGFNLTADDGHEIDSGAVSKLKVPRYVPLSEKSVETTCKRLFANAHTYHINSVSVNSDGENFMSADDLRINLWNVEITDQCFSE
jgi:serine/threonine-protein phosphatase 2A regulatory subunit B